MNGLSDRNVLRNHIRKIGRFDIDALNRIYTEPSIKRKINAGWKNFTNEHPDWEEQGLKLMGSFLKRVPFCRNRKWWV